MRASRQSVKAHQSFGSICSSLSTGFQVYLTKYWGPDVSPGSMIQLVFFCSFSAFFQHVDLVTTSLRAGFQFYLLALGSVNVDQDGTIRFVGSWI